MSTYSLLAYIFTVLLCLSSSAHLEAQVLLSGKSNKVKVLVDTPSTPDFTNVRTFVPLPRAMITNLKTKSGPLIIQLCGEVSFGPAGAPPTEAGAMSIEVHVDDDLARPGTLLLAQNITPQVKCATFIKEVSEGSHTLKVLWRSLGGEWMSMGFRTLTVFFH